MHDDALTAFERARGRLFGLAYRMLGSVTDAEDVVQETWLRWQRVDPTTVREPMAFLTTTATRIALNTATSAYARRTTYVGSWLPEPVDTSADPELGAVAGATVALAVLMLMESLTPTQRAAFILHEAFGYSYRDVGGVLEVSEASARQLAARGRTALRRERRTTVARPEQERLLRAFVDAARGGDLVLLESMLAQDARAVADGGGVVTAARIPVLGRTNVARFVIGAAAKFDPGTESTVVEANGAPALRFTRDGQVAGLLSLEVVDTRVEGVYVVLNPEKLTGWAGERSAA